MSQNQTSQIQSFRSYLPNLELTNSVSAVQPSNSSTFSNIQLLHSSGMNTGHVDLGTKPIQLQVKNQFAAFTHFLAWNNSIMVNLLEKNRMLQDNIKYLEEQLDRIKETIQVEQKPKIAKPLLLDTAHKGDSFISKKFGEKTYKFCLAAIKSIPKQLYKERNFNMAFKLIDSEKNLIINCNPIPVSLCLYESNSEAAPIEINKSGKPIIKGNCQSILYHGKCEFRKIHIRQVTSYYQNGWIYAVIYPKQPSFNYTYKDSNVQVMVDYQEVKPFVVSNVVVRAKKK